MTLNAKFTDETTALPANLGLFQIVQPVKPIPIEEEMTQPVGIDSEGKLFTLPSSDISTVDVEQTEKGALIKVTNRDGVTTATPVLNGTDGKDGADGFSPIVELTPTDQGVQIDVTSRNGGSGALVYHGKDGFSPKVELRGTTGGNLLMVTDKDGKTSSVIIYNGTDGADGKSAYAYAKDGGYTGTEEEFAEKIAADTPTSLPNPYPLTINGKSYNGSEAVDITITGGASNDTISLGQTPVTLTEDANIRLVGSGEHSFSVTSKTVADLSTATVSQTNVTLTEQDGYIELKASGSPANWYNAVATLAFNGLTAGESYVFCIESPGLDTTNLISNGYFLIRDGNSSELGRIEDEPAGIANVSFTATTETVSVLWYVANNYYWNKNYRTAQVGDIYINKGDLGTDRTDVFQKSGTFTDSYSLGQLSKGTIITAEPNCEVYSVSSSTGTAGVGLPLLGKTVVCFGDSLFGMYTGDTSAPAYIAQKTGATVYNVGFGGCRMSAHPYTGYNEFSMYALSDAVASGDWAIQDAAVSDGGSNFPDQLAILKTIDFNQVDMVVIHYGTNDFTAGEGVAIDKAGNPTATNTLCGALRYSIEKLLTAYPQLQIFVSLPAFRYWTANGTIIYSDEKQNVNGHTLPEFVKALAETAKEYKLPVIDCYYGLGINQSNAATFLGDGVHHNAEGRKRFGEYIGTKLIANGDTFLGDSIDVTAEVGQTIVVKEVDENGKPTKWESAEYHNFTDEIIPLTTFTPQYNESFGAYVYGLSGELNASTGLEVGREYTVIFDGVKYVCTAKNATAMGMSIIFIGNGMIAGLENTGEPFVLASTINEGVVWDGVGFLGFDGNSHTVHLTTHKIPENYIPNVCTVHLVECSLDVDLNPTTNATVSKLQDALNAGKWLVARIEMYGLILYAPLEDITTFDDIDPAGTMRFGNSWLTLKFIPQEDGTYSITVIS